ncbi:MAG: glycogen synthase GlgA [Pseudomonadota bacterium]|nr:glycogen synthase GlgA [Pseudomonadota bacterium]
MPAPRVLFVASEAYPLAKTGGLADVAGALPGALRDLGVDARLLLPAYRGVREAFDGTDRVARLVVDSHRVVLWQGQLPGGCPVYLIDVPALFDREGDPYHDASGQPWADNAARFALFCRVAELIACAEAGLDWCPDLVHCNDWQSGLVPVRLAARSRRPRTVFTIHNLAYQGLFPAETFSRLDLPPGSWSLDGVEFHGQVSFIKGGIAYADRVTTVSPSYAREIQTPETGAGLEGLLRHRREALSGILNGIDTAVWNPARDPHLPQRYSVVQLAGKAYNKAALQEEFGMRPDARRPLCCFIGRLVEQKGADLLLRQLPQLLAAGGQLLILGSGDKTLETQLVQAAAARPDAVAARIGYDEALAHRLQGGADLLLMPSRFEPCGLNQLYAMAYGTVPVVHAVGGLADSVTEATSATIGDGSAGGFRFQAMTSDAFGRAIERALALYRDAQDWLALRRVIMAKDHSWRRSAEVYLDLYRALLATDTTVPPAA